MLSLLLLLLLLKIFILIVFQIDHVSLTSADSYRCDSYCLARVFQELPAPPKRYGVFDVFCNFQSFFQLENLGSHLAMCPDDRFLPQGKQILPEICQVRPMPYSYWQTVNFTCKTFQSGSPACSGEEMPDRVSERTWAHVTSFLIVHMSHIDSCQSTLIWLTHIVLFLCWIGRCNILYQFKCRGKMTGLSSESTRWSCDNGQQMSDFDSCQSNHTHTCTDG